MQQVAQLLTRAELGLVSPLVTVEVHASNGLPSFTLVGLPESAVRESKDRVRSAIQSSGFDYPSKRLTVNLAPADLPKQGGRYDLSIALGLLAATQQVNTQILHAHEWVGELGLDGSVRAVPGVLPIALAARQEGRFLVVPYDQLSICAAVPGLKVLGAKSLRDVVAYMNNGMPLARPTEVLLSENRDSVLDLADVRGQALGKRALEIAAAGGHSLILVGPPGSGKSMLASRLASILPPLNEQQRLEVAAIHSVAGQPVESLLQGRIPMSSPHHSSSAIALVGGGANRARPGAISLSHHGVLFLDELPEFDRRTLEMLREPLESREVRIARAAYQTCFPANFQLIAAMNPSPCGFFSDDKRYRSTPEQTARYLAKISGPLLDRIDLQIELPAVEVTALQALPDGESSAVVAARVKQARDYAASRGKLNAELTPSELDVYAKPDSVGEKLLVQAMQRLGLSARSYHRILRVGRTIADLAASEEVKSMHIAEALSCRMLEKRMVQLGVK